MIKTDYLNESEHWALKLPLINNISLKKKYEQKVQATFINKFAMNLT